MTYGVVSTWNTGSRSRFTDLVEALDHQNRDISCQRQNLVSLRSVGECSRQNVDEFVQVEMPSLEQLHAREGEYNVCNFRQDRGGVSILQASDGKLKSWRPAYWRYWVNALCRAWTVQLRCGRGWIQVIDSAR